MLAARAKQGVMGLAEFTLPKNSKITKGREYKPEEGKRLKTFKIYRYDPDSGANPRYDLNPDYRYVYRDNYIYVVNPRTYAVERIIDALTH